MLINYTHEIHALHVQILLKLIFSIEIKLNYREKILNLSFSQIIFRDIGYF